MLAACILLNQYNASAAEISHAPRWRGAEMQLSQEQP
jgi:hypothetical protein